MSDVRSGDIIWCRVWGASYWIALESGEYTQPILCLPVGSSGFVEKDKPRKVSPMNRADMRRIIQVVGNMEDILGPDWDVWVDGLGDLGDGY